jgi:hypothetical protein
MLMTRARYCHHDETKESDWAQVMATIGGAQQRSAGNGCGAHDAKMLGVNAK